MQQNGNNVKHKLAALLCCVMSAGIVIGAVYQVGIVWALIMSLSMVASVLVIATNDRGDRG